MDEQSEYNEVQSTVVAKGRRYSAFVRRIFFGYSLSFEPILASYCSMLFCYQTYVQSRIKQSLKACDVDDHENNTFIRMPEMVNGQKGLWTKRP